MILVHLQNQITDDQDDIEEIGVVLQPIIGTFCLHFGKHCDTARLDLEDERLRKMFASPLYIQERAENEGQTRAYHSERESLMINSSRSPEVSGKLDAECVEKVEANAQRT